MTGATLNLIEAAFLAFLVIPASVSQAKDQPVVHGWIEEGLLLPEDVSVKIKLDTGAKTSSMDAKNLEPFEKANEHWVRFNVDVKDSDSGKLVSVPFERKVERNVKLRGAGGEERRPVVLMKICIGKKIYNEEFSLKDRGKMLYPVLIGRNTLKNLGPVDVSRTFTMEPNCGKGSVAQ